jgi:hypothetical protein
LVLVGIGPQTSGDLVFHVGILFVLVWGLIITAGWAAPKSFPSGKAEPV